MNECVRERKAKYIQDREIGKKKKKEEKGDEYKERGDSIQRL